jgi:1-deoxy-D-xylulose-5-phosphate reductoisomerase
LRIAVLGSTGSIGQQTLDVVDRLRETGRSIDVIGLAAGRNVDLLASQIERHAPTFVSIRSEEHAERLRRRFPSVEILHGDEGLRRVAVSDIDLLVNGLVGAVGLRPTLEALGRGRVVALANKESLVVGGDLVREVLVTGSGRLFPLDSEHSGLLQCLEKGRGEDVARVILTASGGPFLRTPVDELESVTAEAALAHPNWAMGSRITVDSATMVNKAFEVIEARFLFDFDYGQIDVVVHPESIVHAFVEYRDGSVLAQLAAHDMRVPIQYALTYPERVGTDLPRVPFEVARGLGFEPLDPERFPAFAIVLDAGRRGGSAPAAVNAADEILVARFLQGRIRFTDIARGLRLVVKRWEDERREDSQTLDARLKTDRWAREIALAFSPGR